ncbi:MAG TPA: hexitol phosphatase HxpB [Bacteroidia bacterium]|nr:hexitol phosphatase HxpB [Bacteroidia bacterium]
MIKAVIFDMDGLLIDSEPKWREAETNVFGRLSVAPSEKDFEDMMGNRIQEVIAKWHAKHPWDDFSIDKTQKEIVEEVGRLVVTTAELMPGVSEVLDQLRIQNSELRIALASSSPLSLIERITKHFDIYDRFDVVCSAEFEKNGKPAPDVFLTAARRLITAPENCLVLEDSYNGVLAAKNAGMKCIAIPAMSQFDDPRFDIADVKLRSLLEFSIPDLSI